VAREFKSPSRRFMIIAVLLTTQQVS